MFPSIQPNVNQLTNEDIHDIRRLYNGEWQVGLRGFIRKKIKTKSQENKQLKANFHFRARDSR